MEEDGSGYGAELLTGNKYAFFWFALSAALCMATGWRVRQQRREGGAQVEAAQPAVVQEAEQGHHGAEDRAEPRVEPGREYVDA